MLGHPHDIYARREDTVPLHPLDSLLALLLIALFFGLLVELAPFRDDSAPPKAPRHGPRPLRPRTPDDCPRCGPAAATPAPAVVQALIPYTQLKSSRGRKKSINTAGFACPHPSCRYFNNTDPTVHPATLRFGDYSALVGYGHHGRHDPIQDFFCQACQRKFTARRDTPLYHLKTAPACVAQVLHAIAEGLSAQAAARVFQMSETTIRCWITRAGQHSYSLHNELMCALQLTHVQLDELRL